VVVRGLEQLAHGASYAEVSQWALRVTGTKSSRKSPPQRPRKSKKKVSPAAKASRNDWHIAADWVEVFGPVIYAPVEAKLRSEALAERARLDEMLGNGAVLDTPQVVLIDDVPVYGVDLAGGKARRDAGFYVLALAETTWVSDGTVGKLRMVRAMPKSNTAAWLLMFDELGYDPDYLVADAGTGILAAYERHFDNRRTKFVPSMWHLANRIDRALWDSRGAHVVTPGGRQLVPDLAEHTRLLHRGSPIFDDSAAWSAWWDELEALLRAKKLPREKIAKQRIANEQRMAAIIPDLALHTRMPVSTGGLETLIAKHVKPMLAMRRTAFANIERTNRLFDLVVASSHGAFDHPSDVAALLRADADEGDGWAVPLRTIADPRSMTTPYSSLRDVTLLTGLANERGLL